MADDSAFLARNGRARGRLGYQDVLIFHPSFAHGYSDFGQASDSFVRGTWRALMAADVPLKALLQTPPYSVEAGSPDQAHEECLQELCGVLERTYRLRRRSLQTQAAVARGRGLRHNRGMESAWIVERAKALGFELCGVVRPETFPELAQFGDWLERGYAGEMAYLKDPRRREPARVIENLRSVIVCALNYNTAHPYSTQAVALQASDSESLRGWVSRYAWGDDYHEVLWRRLNALVATIKDKITEPFVARAYADTGPVAERVFAKYAGLGWLGKNTLLLNEVLGSWLFLGVIFTSLELTPTLGAADVPPPDLCGHCRQCLDACPTGALVEPYVLDARRCISYLTIELRGPIPGEFREAMGWQVYGCDICQDVCPFNRDAPRTTAAAFAPRVVTGKNAKSRFLAPLGITGSAEQCDANISCAAESLRMPRLEWLAGLTAEEFRELFRGSAIKRAKWTGLVRNACIALGNATVEEGTAALSRTRKLLERLAENENFTIAESARWALSRIQSLRKK